MRQRAAGAVVPHQGVDSFQGKFDWAVGSRDQLLNDW